MHRIFGIDKTTATQAAIHVMLDDPVIAMIVGKLEGKVMGRIFKLIAGAALLLTGQARPGGSGCSLPGVTHDR
jgi:hypothetical protein